MNRKIRFGLVWMALICALLLCGVTALADGEGGGSEETHTHNMEAFPANDATCTDAGNSAYWYCSGCGKYFSDENGTNEINKDSWIIPALNHNWGDWTVTTPATCSAVGEQTRVCKNNESHKETQEVAIDASAHNWGDVTYIWEKDNTTVTAKRVCKNNESHEESETATAEKETVEATYEAEGKITYTAVFQNEAFAKQTKEEVIPKLVSTEAPATEAPATEAPATEAPATEPPATEAPATEPPVYTIAFDTKGGSQIEPITLPEGEKVPKIEEPTRDGYVFMGWDQEIPMTMPRENLTISANWKAEITGIDLKTTTITITYSPSAKNVLKLLPQTAKVTLGGDIKNTTTANLTWSSESKPSYSKSAGDGKYTFTLESVTTDTDNPLAANVDLPTCTLTVAPGTFKDKQATYKYRLNDNDEVTIVECVPHEKVTELVIPELFNDIYPVTYIEEKLFFKNDKLTSIELPKGVKGIGDSAFEQCSVLETLVLPDSLEGYGDHIIRKDDALVNLVLRTDMQTTLSGKKTFERTVVKEDGKETTLKLELPMAVTDIIVNSEALTVGCDFTVESGHNLSVEIDGTLKLAGGATLKNLSTVNNEGAISYAGAIVTCGGEWKGNAPEKKKGGSYVSEHVYEAGYCTGCGLKEDIVVTTLDIKYVGSGLTKVYDKTRNVTLKGSDFKITGMQDGHTAVRLTGLRAAYDSDQCGDRKVSVSFTIGGDDAERYRTKDITISAKITPKELTITPTEAQKKVYGAADPSYFTGKVKGLMSGDTITGRLARESGENVGKYKILQGTIDAGANYKVVMAEETFEIEAKSINSTDVGLITIGNQRYTGSAIEPDVTLRFGTLLLKKDTDFKVKYSNNTDQGTAKVVITGIGNFTGERETSFRILKISTDPGSGSGGSGYYGGGSGSGGSGNTGDDDDDDEPTYSHEGFSHGGFSEMEDGDDFFDDEDDGEGDDFDDEDDGDDLEDDEEDDEVAIEEAGRLIVDETDYGTVLFNEKGESMAFATFDEEIEPGQRVLTIVPEPLKDEETGEELFLSDGIREQYGEQHLKLGASLMQTLIDRGFTEIVYEVEQADVHIPTASLVSEIVLPDADDASEGLALDVEIGDGEFAEEEAEQNIAPEILRVSYYDICLQQIDDTGLTEREQKLLEGEGDPLMAPPYRLRIRAVPVGQEEDFSQVGDEQALLPEEGDEGEALSKPVGVKLPDGCYPEGARLMLLPTEDVQQAPEGAELVYISILDEDEDEDISQRTPAEFAIVDDILYASIPLTADGVYAVSAPEDSLVLYEDADDGFEVENEEGL